MPIAMHHEGANVFRLQMSGTLRKADLDRCQDALIGEMDRLGPLRLLFVLQGFEGWEPKDDWSDLSFYVNHGDRIERIALVGDERWRAETLMFAVADLRKAPVEFFPAHAVEDARAWIAAPASTVS